MRLTLLPLSIFLAAVVSASASQSLLVADVVDSKEAPASLVGLDQALPAIEDSGVREAAPDVVHDPDAGVEVLSHLEPGFNKGIQQDMTAATRQAYSILAAAKTRAVPLWRGIFTSVSAALGRARITWPNPGYDFQGCRPATLAFVRYAEPNVIYVCTHGLRTKSGKGMAQLLIHEAAHVDGHWDECMATRIEVNAMRLSGTGVAFKNDYWARCGIN